MNTNTPTEPIHRSLPDVGPYTSGPVAPSRVQYVEVDDFEPVHDSESHGLLEYWQILRRHQGTFLFIAFLGALAGLLVTLPQTPIYQARTTLEIMVPIENSLNFKDAAATENIMDFLDTYLHTQVKILQSDSLRERVMAKLGSERPPELALKTSRLSAWRKILGMPEPAEPVSGVQAVAQALTQMQIRSSPNTRIVEVLADSPDGGFAARFANTLADEYIDQNLEFRLKGSQHTTDWLTRQIDDLKIKLERSEEQLQAYSRASGLVYTGEKENVVEDKLKELQDELSKAQAERMAKQSQYEIASRTSADALPQSLDSGSLREHQTKLADLRRQLLELSFTYTPSHPKVQRLQKQIAELESVLKKEVTNVVSRLQTEYEGARQHENLLSVAYAKQAQLVSEQAGRAIQYNILKREVDTNRQLYESMLQKVKETSIVSALKASNTRVIDPAKTPKRPYKPNLFLNTALGALSGVFLGVIFVFVREHADLSLKAPGDAAFYLKLPELGVIPRCDAQSSKSSYGHAPAGALLRPGSKPNGGATSDGNEKPDGQVEIDDKVELITVQHRVSLVAESFRAALTSILLSGHNGGRPRVLVFTSAGPGEGKSTTVSNIGIALAEINRRVLLVDADMRKPRLHTIFDLPNTWGLSDLLREKNSLAASPREALARETHIPGLFVLTSGPATISISNLLYSPRAAELLQRFRSEFDAVLIDTPPMMQIADARVLGRLADAVILVVGAGRATRDALRAAKQRLVEDGIPLLGTILNRWDPKSASSYGVYGYYDGYYGKRSK